MLRVEPENEYRLTPLHTKGVVDPTVSHSKTTQSNYNDV